MNLMKAAHEMAREIKKEFKEVDYKFQLGLCIKCLHEERKNEKKAELKGSEKQIKWATQIREEKLKEMEEFSADMKEYVKHRAELFLKRNSKKTVKDLTEKRLRSYSTSFVQLRNFEQGILIEELEVMRKMLLNETSSSFFIENRMQYAVEIARMIGEK